MVVARRRYRSSGALISQIISDASSISSGGVTSSKFTDFEHRSSKMVLKRVQLDMGCESGANSALQSCEIAIIAKPISEGVPIAADFNNEKYVKWLHQCYSVRQDGLFYNIPDFVHWIEILKIVIDIGWDVYVSFLNNGGITERFDYWMRLFVKYI